MPTATTSDVRGVIDTSLDDSAIDEKLNDAEYEAKDAITNYSTELTTEDRTQLEKYLAALLIRTSKEKPHTSKSGANRSVSYEDVMSVSELRLAVDKRDPSGELSQTVVTDSNRYVGSAGGG